MSYFGTYSRAVTLLSHDDFLHLQNSMTPYSTATMPLGLGGGGAMSGETLKPVIPPFLPQPSFDLAAEAWSVPSNQKSRNNLDLTIVCISVSCVKLLAVSYIYCIVTIFIEPQASYDQADQCESKRWYLQQLSI